MHPVLQTFHPDLAAWFDARYAAPTPVQEEAWPIIASGAHALVTAPTGSGKTLTAFLCALDGFARGALAPGATRVLYVSPLKALNNDIRVNLYEPLAALRERGVLPDLTVQVRSGDTSQSDRQRMLRRPPDVLITTPESLHLLLTTTRGQQALSTIETVILDEVHAIADNRRGAQLMVSLERLARLAGEYQRLALSATIEPLEAVARYIGGAAPDGTDRAVQIVNAPLTKEIELTVRFPEEAKHAIQSGKKLWDPLSDDFRVRIEQNQSTLFFTNSRRLAEKITLKINEPQSEPVAYAHHGSLAKDIRAEVERRLKAGELKAIVATSSLEMGIDIGALDEVVMVQSPPSIAATLQRIGRAGHQVGAVSVGTIYPTHAHDFLEASVLSEQVNKREIEPLEPLHGPLDVLVQVVISMCAQAPVRIDDLYAQIICAGSYRELARSQFDLVIEMLSGRYAGTRVRELRPRLEHDRIKGTVKSNRGAVLAMYNSGGNIPDRGYFTLRHADTNQPIGELDEEFVWEATTGQVFTLGTQSWQIQRITHNDVVVRAAKPDVTAPPFWRSESFNRSEFFSSRILEELEEYESLLERREDEQLSERLVDERGFEPFAAGELVSYLKDQREHTERALPHRHHVLLELVEGGPDGYRGPDAPKQLVIHTLWGGGLNRPFAYALEAALRQSGAPKPEVHADDNAVVVQMREVPDPTQVLGWVTASNVDPLLREGLETSGYFGARFRECAGRSLLLPKQKFNQRLPLWLSRLQAKKLMNATRELTDFPVLLEAWRTCLQDEFDLTTLRERLLELQDGTISWSYAHTRTPSPFAGAVRFEQISRYMYADDTPDVGAASALSGDLIAQAVADPGLRPVLKEEVVRSFVSKRQRTAPGYAPADLDELVEWLKERALVPASEWQSLTDEMGFPTDHEYIHTIEADERVWVCHAEHLASWLLLGAQPTVPTETAQLPPADDLTALCLEVLSFYGPLTADEIRGLLPQTPDDVWGRLATDVSVENLAESAYCDPDNLEALLRFQRAQQRVSLDPIEAFELPAFFASQQGFAKPLQSNPEIIADVLELLSGASAPVSTWLNDIVPARIPDAQPHDLDQAFESHGFAWQGTGKERITLSYPEDRALRPAIDAPEPELTALFADPNARYTFQQIGDTTPLDAARLNGLWWQSVWSGALASDSLTSLRDAASRRYALAADTSRRSRRHRVRSFVRGWPGTWYLHQTNGENDPVSALEDAKERARVLLERYGVVCREIVVREGWRWRDVFGALRIMELAGEVVQGWFCNGLGGPQFASPAGIQRLTRRPAAPPSWWINATDPASPCGLSLDWPQLPQRRGANYLAFLNSDLALVVENLGKRLSYHVDPDHPDLDAVHAVLAHLITHHRRLEVLDINGESARKSPYLAALGRTLNVTSDHRAVVLQS